MSWLMLYILCFWPVKRIRKVSFQFFINTNQLPASQNTEKHFRTLEDDLHNFSSASDLDYKTDPANSNQEFFDT